MRREPRFDRPPPAPKPADNSIDVMIIVLFWLLIVLVSCAFDCGVADAQDLVVPDAQLPTTGEILALDAGERAPHDGMLIADEDLVAWRQAIERLTFQLAALRELDARTLALRLDEERARTRAAEERVTLRDELWRDRAQELATALSAAQAQRGPAWYEQPLLWVVVGAILGGAVVGLVAAALN